jgi:hypothetical protein
MVNDDSKCLSNALTTSLLMDAGVALMRQNLRRRHPDEAEASIDLRLRAWLHRVDDHLPGDVAGPFRIRQKSS